MSLTREGRDDLCECKGVWVQTCMVRGAIKGEEKNENGCWNYPWTFMNACLYMCTPCSGGFMPICFIFIWRFTNYDIQLLTGFRTRLTCFTLWQEIFQLEEGIKEKFDKWQIWKIFIFGYKVKDQRIEKKFEDKKIVQRINWRQKNNFPAKGKSRIVIIARK